MAGRRANGEGSIYPLKNRKGKTIAYRVVISINLNGELKRVQRRRRTHADAAATLQELRNDRGRLLTAAIAKAHRKKVEKAASAASQPAIEEAELPVVLSAEPTTENYLRWWLQKMVKPHRAENTYFSIVTAVNHIVARLGANRLANLTAVHVHDLLAAMDNDGIKAPTRRFAFVILKRALKHAVRPLHLIKEHPCDDIAVPSAPVKKIQPFDQDEVRAILDELRDTRHYAPVLLAFMCGLRQGEIAGLQPHDIKWKAKKIRVERQVTRSRRKQGEGTMFHHILKPPKSSAGTREVPLPEIVIVALKNHQAIRMAEGHAGEEQLFPAQGGGLMDPTRLNREAWKSALKRAGIRFRGFHHARHTYATNALSNGTSLAVVSKTMGHSSQLITLKTYSHWMPAEEFTAAKVMDRLFG
jgi:integrase